LKTGADKPGTMNKEVIVAAVVSLYMIDRRNKGFATGAKV
jgi:hypothetical protein